MSLETARLRLDSSVQRINDFVDRNIVKWATEEIIKPIQEDMRGRGLSAAVQNSVEIVKDGYLDISVEFNYEGDDGEPVDQFLENGFRPHVIEAKGKENGGADALRWEDSSGKVFFRRKVFHPGFEGYHFIERGIKLNEQNLERRIEKEVGEWLEKERIR